jgi:hypothetical protein
MEINQVIQYLKDNGHLLPYDRGFILSEEFIQFAIQHEKQGKIFDIQKIDKQIALLPRTATDWQQLFIAFIQEAKVPAKLEDHRGNLYPANKYNQDACKAFIKAIDKEGYDYNLLVKSTMLYYKSGIRLKKAIGTYFSSGEFRSDYLNLKTAAESGETELKQHLKDETNNGEHNRYSLG